MKPHMYLDLDRTLFDTEAFMRHIFTGVQGLFNIPTARFKGELPQFYGAVAGLRYYDFFGHLAAYGLPKARAGQALRRYLSGQDFMFTDARYLLGLLARSNMPAEILSFGLQDFQQFKYSLCPQLSHLPLKTLLADKAQYIAARPGAPSFLVDDKITRGLPGWCTMVQVDRTAQQGIGQKAARLWRINSLVMVESLPGVGYNERS